MNKDNPVFPTLSVLISLILWWAFFSDILPTRIPLIILSALSMVWGGFLFKRTRNSVHSFLTVSGGMVILALIWAMGFDHVKMSGDLSGDIFRGVYTYPWKPLYAKPRAVDPQWWMGIVALTLITLVISILHWSRKMVPWVLLLVLGIGTLLVVPEGSWPPRGHFSTLSERITIWSDWGQILPEYTVRSNELDVHSSHYPPGLFLISWFSGGNAWVMFGANFVASLVIAMLVIKRTRLNWTDASILYLLIPGVLLFTAIAPEGIAAVFFFLAILTFMDPNRPSIERGIIVGFLLWMGAMFSYLVFPVGVFLFLLVLIDPPGTLPRVISMVVSMLLVMIGLSWILFLTTGYDYLIGLQTAIGHNQRLLGDPDTYSNPEYLIRSTGNLLAFFLTMGPLFISRILINGLDKRGFILVIWMLIMGFSGLFFMETERIWFLVYPLMFIFLRRNGPLQWYEVVPGLGYIALLSYFADLSFGSM